MPCPLRQFFRFQEPFRSPAALPYSVPSSCPYPLFPALFLNHLCSYLATSVHSHSFPDCLCKAPIFHRQGRSKFLTSKTAKFSPAAQKTDVYVIISAHILEPFFRVLRCLLRHDNQTGPAFFYGLLRRKFTAFHLAGLCRQSNQIQYLLFRIQVLSSPFPVLHTPLLEPPS